MNTVEVIDCPEARILAGACAWRGSFEATRAPGIVRPFRLGDWLYGTDGRILARLAVELAPPELARAVGPPKGAVPLRFLEEIEFKLRAIDRERPASIPEDCGPVWLPCPTCRGAMGGTACGDCVEGRIPNDQRVRVGPGAEMAALVAARLRDWEAAAYLPAVPPPPPRRGDAMVGPDGAAYWITAEGVEGLAALMAPARPGGGA